LAVEKISGGIFAACLLSKFRRLIFGAAAPAAKLIEANIRDDAINPGIEAAFKTEAVQILINFQESFLVNVAGVFRFVENIEGDSQDVAIVAVHEFLKRLAVTRLRALD
jgi:hypothetical protein